MYDFCSLGLPSCSRTSSKTLMGSAWPCWPLPLVDTFAGDMTPRFAPKTSGREGCI